MFRGAVLGISALYLLALAAGGCSAETGSTEDLATSCEGAKLDQKGFCRAPNGKFAKNSCCAAIAPAKYACDVIDVNEGLNGSLLEESLISRNAISEDGYLEGDSDATSADLQIGRDAQSVWLGHYQWSSEDGDKIQEVPRSKIDVSEWIEQDVVEYKITPATPDGAYRVRIYKDSLIGLVTHEGNGLDGTLAALDCRDVLSKPMAEPIDEEDVDCEIAWFDYELRDYDGQFGAAYSLDYFDFSNGTSEIDESYVDVHIGRKAAGWGVTLGGYGFSQEDGDAVTFKETASEDDDLGAQLTWKVAGQGWDDTFEVRLWRETGMGVVIVNKNDDEPRGKLAVIDCRGHDRPNVYE